MFDDVEEQQHDGVSHEDTLSTGWLIGEGIDSRGMSQT
jgi:hypothetical protein